MPLALFLTAEDEIIDDHSAAFQQMPQSTMQHAIRMMSRALSVTMQRLNIFLALFLVIVSTIAACNVPPDASSPYSSFKSNTDSSSLLLQIPRAASVSCATCNKAFCLSQRLPICKDAEEKDVLTTCFQRDSTKDQIVVLTFIAGTVGLLAWAGVRKIVERRRGEGLRIGESQSYVPVGR
ncbi:hypothetical protein JHW43_004042 [Diplocarpon mali]|nr:hypothetical protein JHW43_004042 [Diplocarpon mali]